MDATERGKLIIAIDFGTTYSGIAYGFSRQVDAGPFVIRNWPDHPRSIREPKVPTLVSYDVDFTSSPKWGNYVDDFDGARIAGIKLLLDPGRELPTYLPAVDMRSMIRELPKPAVEIAADFLRSICNHAMQEIALMVPGNYVERCEREFVLSAEFFRISTGGMVKRGFDYPPNGQAAQSAGIHPVSVIKEPEAAAIYAIRTLDYALEKNDAFIVCDAGGGTVDLISYEVEATLPRPRVREIVPAGGGMAGSLALNHRFAAVVRRVVGDYQWTALSKMQVWKRAMKHFDRFIKRDYRGVYSEYNVDFPMANLRDDPGVGLASDTWHMTWRRLDFVFNPVFDDVKLLIADQVEAIQRKRPDIRVKAIVLVGGLGSSQYLLDTVRWRFPEILVLQPEDAWHAVAKGGVLSKLLGETVLPSWSDF